MWLIDHFRGFDEYFSIPYGSETAVDGHWEKGPGIELFRAVEQALGKREIIAEDLGYMSDTVRQLVRDSGFPGMKVLEFAFDSRDTGSASDYLPHNYPVNSVAYTGTHDNETLVSWYQTISDAERAMVRDYLYDYATPDEQLYKSMIALILRSAAAMCMDMNLVGRLADFLYHRRRVFRRSGRSNGVCHLHSTGFFVHGAPFSERVCAAR